MARFQELLRAANNLRLLTAIGRSGGELASVEHVQAVPVGAAVAHGHAIARRTQCLAAVKWEEGWEKPVHQWRQELGLGDPADAEPYGLDAQLGVLP